MIKILQIVDNISRDSGISSFLMNMYRSIDRSRFQFDFLVAETRKSSYEDEIVSLGGKVIYFGSPFSIKNIIRANTTARRFIKDNIRNYSVYHLHTSTMCLFTLRHVKRFGGECRIVHSHSSMTSPNPIKAFVNRVLNLSVFFYANCFCACSTEAADFLYGKTGKIRQRAIGINNAVDSNKFQYRSSERYMMRSAEGITNEKVFLHVSNFTPIKNTLFLAKVIVEYAKLDNAFKLYMVGDGPEREKVENYLLQHGLSDKVVFTGKVSDPERYFNMADIFMLSSIKEGLPLTIVEAQACGLPCVVTNSITRECLIEDVTFLPLIETEWIEYILQKKAQSDGERQKRSSDFVDSGFCIIHEVCKLEKLYSGACDCEKRKQATKD